MRRFRFSIAGMLGLVGLTALGFAAIRASSPPWAGVLTSVTFFAMIASLLGIGLGRGDRRVFWIGFALLGWSYLTLTLSVSGWSMVRTYLFAPNLSDMLFPLLHGEDGATGGGSSGMTGSMPMGGRGMGGGFRSQFGGGGMGGAVAMTPMMGGGMGGTPGPAPGTVAEPYALTQVLCCLEALLWAVLGGWTARYFASKKVTDPSLNATPPPASRSTGGGVAANPAGP